MLQATQCVPAFRVINAGFDSRVILVCDHASNRVEASLKQLGLPDTILQQHIAYDIGAAAITEILSELLRSPAVLSEFSRLVIDPNRYIIDPTSIPEVSDAIDIIANKSISQVQRSQRVERFFKPYHQQISHLIDAVVGRNARPFLISIHSFTPELNGDARPWGLGVLMGRDDDRQALQLIENLRRETPFNIGVNQPYDAKTPMGYTTHHHAVERGFEHLLIEIRQDLIANDSQQRQIAGLLHRAIRTIL